MNKKTLSTEQEIKDEVLAILSEIEKSAPQSEKGEWSALAYHFKTGLVLLETSINKINMTPYTFKINILSISVEREVK